VRQAVVLLVVVLHAVVVRVVVLQTVVRQAVVLLVVVLHAVVVRVVVLQIVVRQAVQFPGVSRPVLGPLCTSFLSLTDWSIRLGVKCKRDKQEAQIKIQHFYSLT
jgi:hypothetical protein